MVRRQIDENPIMSPSVNPVDLEEDKPQPRNQKLQCLEAEMAGIEMSLATSGLHNSKLPVHRKILHKHDTFPKSSTSRPVIHKQEDRSKVKVEKITSTREHHKTLLLQELELLKENLKEKDDLLKLFQQENESLQNQQIILPKFVTKEIGDINKKDGEKTDYRLQQLSLEIENKETLLKSLHTIVEQLETNKDIDSSIHHAELEYKIAVEESALLTLKHQYFMLQSEINIEYSSFKNEEILSETDSFFCFIRSHPHVILVTAEIPGGNFGRYGFGVSACPSGRGIYIELVNDSIPLKRGDRLLEVNNHLVFNKSQREFKQLMSGLVSPLRIVALRVCSTDTNHELTSEVKRLESENICLKMENKELTENLKIKSESFNNAWTDLKNLLANLRKDLDKESPNDSTLLIEDSKDKPVHTLQDLEALFEAKHEQLQPIVASQTKLSTLKMDRFDPDGTEKEGECGEKSPVICDRLRFSKKVFSNMAGKLTTEERDEILTVLQNQTLESSTQKMVLDTLLALVIDHAPHLLSQVNEKQPLQDRFEDAATCEEAWC